MADGEDPVVDPVVKPGDTPEVKPAPALEPVTPAKAEESKPAAVDPNSIPLEQILLREDVKRAIQSAKDVEVAREKRRLQDEQRNLAEEDRRRKQKADRDALIAAQDFEALGRQDYEREQAADSLKTAAETVSATIEKVVKEHPDFQVLGQDRIEEIYGDVRRNGGNVVEFTLKLGEERRLKDVEKATREATATLPSLVATEVEARLSSLGLSERSKAAEKGDTPSLAVSGDGTPKVQLKDETYETMSVKYGDGDATWDEFKPFFEAHKKERKR